MDPFTGALVGAGANFLASSASSLFAPKPKKSKVQQMKELTMDDIMAGIRGEGPYSYLFNMDESAFQRGVADPAMARFNNQWAPQIQQQYISSGQQRGTGLEDTLTRAGVDLNQQINEQYWNAQQQANQNKLGALTGSLNWQDPYSEQPSAFDSFLSGGAGYLQSSGARSDIGAILDAAKKRSPISPQQPSNLAKGSSE
tara:strand:- start:9974 stop:10570 length:597 start_codon:yes stop_codon:yes gene_type:complete